MYLEFWNQWNCQENLVPVIRFRFRFREFNAISILGLGLSGILHGGRPVYTLLGITLPASRTDLANLGGLAWGGI